MAGPTRNDVCLGLAFVFVGVIYALSNRWQRELVVQGVITRKPHKFDHLFVMWTLQQLLQLSLLLVWKFIQNDWFGCSRFMHGERNRGNALAGVQAMERLPPANDPAVRDEVAPPQDEVVRNRRINKKPSKLVYFPPAFFALAHVLLLYFGLKLTYSSSFIMLKGTVVLFTALLSLAFLAQQLRYYVWFGVVVATIGFAVSGISDYIHFPSGYEKYGIAAGDLLILMAQIMFATKIIYEQKFIRKHFTHPMVFLGCEGVYGSFFAIVLLLAFNFADAVQYSSLPNGRLEDVKDFVLQLSNSWHAVLAVIGSLVSYILYTYLGMFLIRDQGALPRIVIETFTWGIYWTICLFLHWENFFIAQVPGLCVIAIGALIYANILPLPFASCLERSENNNPMEGVNNDHLHADQPDNDQTVRPNGENNEIIPAEDNDDVPLLH
ncbi:unnamed protein product [Candidula unifasciata]|uniref:Solute carrier family 35 member F6 n=1 Tax=Candidula unifasciata TaxID=100452 RepID=A0A8S3Z1F7_9EUPU|nr:unnamed protein product [Candidula unifasciata]